MSQISQSYALALYDLAREEVLAEDILLQLDVLAQGFDQEPAFVRLLSASNISKEERCRILDDSFRGKVHPYVLNFLKILTEKGYMRHFSDCCRDYRDQYNRDNGILPVQAVTAVALTAQQTSSLMKKLADMTGKKVDLTNRVDPDCLGGVRLVYDGKCVDGTVRGRLDSISAMLKNTIL